VRAHYALGEGRAPAVAALGSAGLGAVLMAAGGALAHGDAKLAVMGAAHSVAYLVGAVVLGVGLARRTGQPLAPARLPRALAVSLGLGAACAAVLHWVDPAGRTTTLGLVILLAAVSGAIYLGALGPRRAGSPSAVDAGPGRAALPGTGGFGPPPVPPANGGAASGLGAEPTRAAAVPAAPAYRPR
jgi:peptidoglycan biosynthesis protein MviN/MurJ (putative lipid II flippase)